MVIVNRRKTDSQCQYEKVDVIQFTGTIEAMTVSKVSLYYSVYVLGWVVILVLLLLLLLLFLLLLLLLLLLILLLLLLLLLSLLLTDVVIIIAS